MTNLPNSPLIYTIAIVRFSPVMAMEKYVADFQDAVRGQYPHFENVQVQQTQIEFGPAGGVEMRQVPATIWQFATRTKDAAVVLSQNLIALHTVSYKDHTSFIADFKSAITKLVDVKNLGIELMSGVAIRYVNLIEALSAVDLHALLASAILPPPFAEVEKLEIIESANVAQYKCNDDFVRFQVLRKPPSALPSDLLTQLVVNNGWSQRTKRPDGDFAVIDIDCSKIFGDATPMDVDAICGHILRLRGVAKAMFTSSGTERAKKYWEGEPL